MIQAPDVGLLVQEDVTLFTCRKAGGQVNAGTDKTEDKRCLDPVGLKNVVPRKDRPAYAPLDPDVAGGSIDEQEEIPASQIQVPVSSTNRSELVLFMGFAGGCAPAIRSFTARFR